MHQPHAICILWDASHIWGLMAWKAIQAFGLPCRLVKGKEIADGFLLGKHKGTEDREALLIVPGGNARRKADALGAKGLSAIREFVGRGGFYIGFCGGAGLALNDKGSLGLCPWLRKPFSDRLQHLASGHVKAEASRHPFCPQSLQKRPISLPIWWPARFSEEADPTVSVLAKAICGDRDFWLGDLPLASIPEECFTTWQHEYDLDLTSDFLRETPLIISGAFGEGTYVLSYSHLETPESKDANLWLAHLITRGTGIRPARSLVPAWRLSDEPCRWPQTETFAPLFSALGNVRSLLALGGTHHLFFQRTPWLYGWKTGMPGAGLNYLHTALTTLLAQTPSREAGLFWNEIREGFADTLRLFTESAKENLLTRRIRDVLGDVPNVVRAKDLLERSRAIFGCPRDGGGLLGSLLDSVEELFFLTQREEGRISAG
ncbi:MAG: hypothetical protein K5657_08990 [Desulfovibrio sp.]|nr:hypothetical protein [Desulfovibrio sp.]